MWLNRLPPEYRRRYYTNLSVIAALILYIFVASRLGQKAGVAAIEALFIFLVAFACFYPLVLLLRYKPRPHAIAFILYGSWICAYAYVIAAAFLNGLPGAGFVLLAGLVLMWTFFAVYRKIVFRSLFDGGFPQRFAAVRAAQRRERADMQSLLDDLSP